MRLRYGFGFWLGKATSPGGITPPGAPVATSATSNINTQYAANWGAVAGATGYKLYAYDHNGIVMAGFSGADVGNVLTYNVTGMTMAGVHTFKVKAYNAAGDSDFSNTVNVSIFTVITGGVQTTDGDYKVVTLNSTQNVVVSIGGSIQELIIAGAGAGGSNDGSGAGAGGVRQITETINPGTYLATIGAGGTATANANGSKGNDTVFNGHTSIGGGYGASYQTPPAGPGGSGGGSPPYNGPQYGLGTSGQGNRGGTALNNVGGGGGGWGGVGGNASSGDIAGKGADGNVSSITGVAVFYAAGGSAGSYKGAVAGGIGGGGEGNLNSGGNGSVNKGSGGGGTYNGGAALAGNGGSGVVILRYRFK